MAKSIKRTLLVSVAVVALAVGTAATIGPAQAISLNEVVDRTVSTHPEIAAIKSNRRAIDQELRAARGQYLPSVDLRGAFGHEWTNNPTTRTRSGRVDGETGWVDMNRYEAGVTVRQLLFDGLGTFYDVDRNKGRVESAQNRVRDTAQAVALRAVEAYLEVQRAREVERIAVANVKIHEQILGRVAQRSTAGRGAESDVDQARARVAAAKVSLASARNKVEDAIAAYRAVVGEMPEGLDNVAPPELELPPNVDEATNYSLENAPSIAAAAADVKAAMANVGVADARFFPVVTAEAAANWNHGIDAIRGRQQDFSMLLVARWNVYRGGIDLARKREAVARMEEARDTLEKTRREVVQQVRFSWNAMNAARERRLSVRAQLESNKKVSTAYSLQYDRGRRTLLDLLDIQNEIFINRTNLVTEDFTVKFGVFRTLATMGKLFKVLGTQLPDEAVRAPRSTLLSE
ncbi:MAG: TolC family outer membrane protein [Alphaproteobacteria bacterium]